jgi:hypothetical protein
MLGNGGMRTGRRTGRFSPAEKQSMEAALAWNDVSDNWEPIAVDETCWDVFLLDDDNAEPEPERGDFWGEPNDPEAV